jgi:tetratricopeptide (TPR) repeat protein
MKISRILIGVLLAVIAVSLENRADDSAKSRVNVKSEIAETTDDIEHDRATKAKAVAKKKNKIKNATSVQDQLSSSEKQKLKESIPFLKNKVAAQPGDLKLQLQLGKAYLVVGDFENAIKHIKEASVTPNPATLYLLAEAYRGKADYLNEIRTLEVILQTDEKDAKANELLGHAYLNTRNFEKSTSYFRKSIALDPKRRTAYDGLLKQFEGKNNRYESRQIYQDMTKVFGEDAQAYSGLCRLYTEDNLAESSIETCRKSIEIDPDIPDNHVYLGMSYKFTKDTAQATKILMKAAQQFKKSELAQWAAGQLGDEMKNWESAKHFYRKCVAIDKQSARCYRRLAMVSFQLKDYEESLKAFNRACELDRTTLTDIRNATSQLRITNQEVLKNKFQQASDKCGF